MHKLLENKLVKKYPKLFKNIYGDPRKTCMAWGLACGKGWFLLLDKLCSKLEQYGIEAAQVKEKLGTLRFYIEGSPSDKFDEIHETIGKFEVKSGETCETCGNPGKRKGGNWIRTICDTCETHREIYMKMRDERKYAYYFDEAGHIIVFDPEADADDDPLFSGTFDEFMNIVGDQLGLLEDPMSTSEKPLWEQI